MTVEELEGFFKLTLVMAGNEIQLVFGRNPVSGGGRGADAIRRRTEGGAKAAPRAPQGKMAADRKPVGEGLGRGTRDFRSAAMLSRVGASRGLRLVVVVVAAAGRSAPQGLLRSENEIQRYFGTHSVFYSKKDEPSTLPGNGTEKASESQENLKKVSKENPKEKLINIIKGMKVELGSKVVSQREKNQLTSAQSRKLIQNVERASSMYKKAREGATLKRDLPLSPDLVVAATAVADSLPFDKQTTKSELLRQLRKHEQESKEQARQGESSSISNIIADMKISKPSSSRNYMRPDHQIQFDEGHGYLLQKEMAATRGQRKGLYKGKSLNIFPTPEETPKEESEAVASPTLWDLEFAKQLATVDEQLPRNGFEEMIQWTKEGKLWEFPINNEAGFDDDGADFHEHIFLDKYLEDFPKQGPIRHFMELVTCGLSKNPYLSVKQKAEHIEWFRNYFHEKTDILKENDIQFN
ncbi:28S ribosomal protein S31, mitochondrial [Tachyglossus aculeatus]|uniref:28S ribosomal protein S31, mitochondrial n=1 Tax=Tachyglossus aculeatus TaxID=9261 RepID=UPI0018F783AD|nr:28S ribosomal protein S31, mitochondrial [Tachyglossus aculeatus]